MTEPTSTGLDARLASVLCYAGWWVTGLVFLFAERQHRGVRFHAAQSLLVFGILSAVMFVSGGASAVAFLVARPSFQLLQVAGNVVWLGAVALWLVLLLRTWRGDTWRVPLVAELLSAKGYMAEAVHVDRGAGEPAVPTLRIHNCAVREIAERCPEACAAEAKFVERLLGVPLVRGAHRKDGCGRCEYGVVRHLSAE